MLVKTIREVQVWSLGKEFIKCNNMIIISLHNLGHFLLLTGGLGGLALEMVNWMVRKGARYFVLTSRTGEAQLKSFKITIFTFNTLITLQNVA